MLEGLSNSDEPLVLSGDGRHDSMGHSAKYGAYTIFSFNCNKIIHFSLVQRNEAGSSTGIEYVAFQRCMDFLLGEGLNVTTFVSDRHGSIAKHMRESLPHITHYFDLWHLQKKLHKILRQGSKEKDCIELAEWIRPCINHLYWSVKSTHSGDGRIMLAKFKSFLNHVVNKHEGFDDPLFNKCAHGDVTPKKWLIEESPAYEHLCNAIQNKSLLKGIGKASPLEQTSCLEGFHSVVNQFSPKMISYSFTGIFCRHILAAIHFNLNLFRTNKERGGNSQVKVVWPKFKGGEATVRGVKVNQDFGYVEEIYQTFSSASPEILEDACKELGEMTPAPIHTMLEREPREVAISKREKRKNLVVCDVPPTTPLNEVLAEERREEAQQQTVRKARAPPRCSDCGSLMKGHKFVQNCPRNTKD